jgi:uncharacterized membrane protein YcaP (DUF421 family)
MELYKIAVRALFSYIFLVALLRLSGKRTVAQGTTFDFVLALILGDMIDDALWAEVPISHFITGTGMLALAQVLVSYGCYRSPRFARLVEGTPTVVMRRGVGDPRALRSEQVNDGELAELLRLNGHDRDDWDRIEIVTIETDGDLSVIERPDAQIAQQSDLEALRRMLP